MLSANSLLLVPSTKQARLVSNHCRALSGAAALLLWNVRPLVKIKLFGWAFN